MHLDDKFFNKQAMEKLIYSLNNNENIKWGGFGFNHNYENQNLITNIIFI